MASSLLDWGMIALQLLLATLCGGLIGYQRETIERPAGFRTHILVCVGSAVYMLVSVAVGGTQWDPGRIAAQVASGIGFLGAGTIIKQGNIVRGLTTAASLWAVAGIGMAAGYGGSALAIAVLGTVTVYIALAFLRNFELHLEHGHQGFLLDITLVEPRLHIEAIRAILTGMHIEITGISIAGESDLVGQLSIDGRAPTRDVVDGAVAQLMQTEGVRSVQRLLR